MTEYGEKLSLISIHLEIKTEKEIIKYLQPIGFVDWTFVTS